jgi:tRNA pseudouridine38-40 synthase
MRTIRLVLAYDGTDYVGWQRQPNGVSIQALVEDALLPIEGRPVTVIGAGRTDAGVHALAQVAGVALASRIDPPSLMAALNATLPPDVRVRAADEGPPGFHARFSATGKVYRYYLREGRWVSPFERRYVWHIPQALDDPAMAAAGQALVGHHDFAAFCAAGGGATTTARTITALHVARIEDEDGALVTIDVEADGFLRHMARAIVGTLVEVGQGRRGVDDVARVLASRDRSGAGPTAPARGLFLLRVRYPADAPGPGG